LSSKKSFAETNLNPRPAKGLKAYVTILGKKEERATKWNGPPPWPLSKKRQRPQARLRIVKKGGLKLLTGPKLQNW